MMKFKSKKSLTNYNLKQREYLLMEEGKEINYKLLFCHGCSLIGV